MQNLKTDQHRNVWNGPKRRFCLEPDITVHQFWPGGNHGYQKYDLKHYFVNQPL